MSRHFVRVRFVEGCAVAGLASRTLSSIAAVEVSSQAKTGSSDITLFRSFLLHCRDRFCGVQARQAIKQLQPKL